ncbi:MULTISPECIES: TIGR03643 family protein [Francisella]|uniref:TIGR03643 family protein n=1 Tax=Francisella TaxID=262 RepID=UPI0011B5E20E|nr:MULTISPECIES: TIGR03643 family protein [Francisella]
MDDKNITISEIIEMAWCDKTSFDAIKNITGLSEPQVIKIMRNNLKPSSFRLWRKRVTGRVAKHQKRLNHTNASSLV